jgi:hypothetical protein
MNLLPLYLDALSKLSVFAPESARKGIKDLLDQSKNLPSDERMEFLLNVIDNISDRAIEAFKENLVDIFSQELRSLEEANLKVGSNGSNDDKVISEACEIYHGQNKEPVVRIVK